MKRIILLFVLIIAFGCKSDKKTVVNAEPIEVVKEDVILSKVNVPQVESWIHNGTTTINSDTVFEEKEIYLLSRDSNKRSSYTAIDYNGIAGSNYRVSVIVKKGNLGEIFGLRIIGVYPNRVDAVFDLAKGELKGATKGGDFENANASIQEISDGWYNCTLSGEVYEDKLRIIFGPTSDKKKVVSWEGVTDKINNIYIIPSSLRIEEIK